MPATTEIPVKIADLPQVRQALDDAAGAISRLRALLQAWSPRIRCPQCGSRYDDPACGPTHAEVFALVWPAG